MNMFQASACLHLQFLPDGQINSEKAELTFMQWFYIKCKKTWPIKGYCNKKHWKERKLQI